MNETEAFGLIKAALQKVSPGLEEKVTMDSHLVDDEIVDSLDSMNFLFELENACGHPLEEVDETFDDFRVKRFVEILTKG